MQFSLVSLLNVYAVQGIVCYLSDGKIPSLNPPPPPPLHYVCNVKTQRKSSLKGTLNAIISSFIIKSSSSARSCVD